jgi:hypothetical protein
MQGVFIIRTLTGWDELEKIVRSHEALVFLEQEKGEAGPYGRGTAFIRIMTEAQKRKYLDRERIRKRLMSTGFPLEWPQPEQILVLETFKSSQDRMATGSRDWMVDHFTCAIRPKTKKELATEVRNHPAHVYLEATSMFGNEYGGPLTQAPRQSFSVVGPDPAKKRSWYGQIFWSEPKGWVVQ